MTLICVFLGRLGVRFYVRFCKIRLGTKFSGSEQSHGPLLGNMRQKLWFVILDKIRRNAQFNSGTVVSRLVFLSIPSSDSHSHSLASLLSIINDTLDGFWFLCTCIRYAMYRFVIYRWAFVVTYRTNIFVGKSSNVYDKSITVT